MMVDFSPLTCYLTFPRSSRSVQHCEDDVVEGLHASLARRVEVEGGHPTRYVVPGVPPDLRVPGVVLELVLPAVRTVELLPLGAARAGEDVDYIRCRIPERVHRLVHLRIERAKV
jgi:hypothetical protein